MRTWWDRVGGVEPWGTRATSSGLGIEDCCIDGWMREGRSKEMVGY